MRGKLILLLFVLMGSIAFANIQDIPINRLNERKLSSKSGKYIVSEYKSKIVSRPNSYLAIFKNNSEVPEHRFNLISYIEAGFGMVICILFAWGYYGYRKAHLMTQKTILLENQMEDKSLYIQELTSEKEWLVKEIHHRVKNNLQIIISLLNSQSSHLNNPEAIQAIKNNQHRMYAISLVHQKLYQAENLSRINMECYINELLQYLQDEFECNKKVAVMVQTVPMEIEVGLAIPLALIINEAVSNSFQYAFAQRLSGKLNLKLETENEDHYLLQISDNGIGLPSDFDSTSDHSFGTILMTGLSRQLHADFEIKNSNGVVITLRFDSKILKAS
jgi:two-component sensor histidine kinase